MKLTKRIGLFTVALLAAFTALASPGYDSHLTVGENIDRQLSDVASKPVEYAQAAPVTISANTNGVTISVPGAPAIPAPPLTNSYFSNTIVFDAGVLTLGIGQTVNVSSYLQGFYNFNQHFAAGLVTEWGAVNTLDALSAAVTVRKIFSDNMEGYAGPELGWDFAGKDSSGNTQGHIRGGAVIGMRWVPFNVSVPNLATHVEFDALYESGDKSARTGVKAGLSYRF